MNLTDLYQKGKEILESRDIGFALEAVETGWVRKNNRGVLDRYAFRQRAIDAPGSASTRVDILGVKLQTPVIMSAMTMPIPAVREGGLLQVAEGLKAAGSLLWTGTPMPKNLAELVALGVPVAQNVKPHEFRKKVFDELEAMQQAGVAWVGLEIDAGMGTKIGDQHMARDCRPFSMADLFAIRKAVKRPLIYKGILSAADARKAVDTGADAVMVSNHGGHTLDYLPHPFQVMDEVLQEIDGKIPVFVDSGFRRGSDVLKGLAFGASLVGLGRPILYGLAANGADGVRDVVQQVTGELARLMAMAGAGDPRHVNRECLISCLS